MPSSHLILCRPLLLLLPIPTSIRVFSNESTLCMRWPKYWSFSFSIIPFKEIPGLIFFRMDWLDLLAVQGTLKSLLQHHSSKASILWHSAFFTVRLSHPNVTTGKTIALTRETFADKSPYSQTCGFSSSHVQMWKLDHKVNWTLKKWFFLTVVLGKTLESPLNVKEIKRVNPNWNNPSIFWLKRTDAEATVPIFWPPNAKSCLIGKDSY